MYEAEILSRPRHSNGVTEGTTRFLDAVTFLAFLMRVQLRWFAARAARKSSGDRENRL